MTNLTTLLPVSVTRDRVSVGSKSHAHSAQLPDGVSAINWYPDGVGDIDKRRGAIVRYGQETEIFDDIAILEPFVAVCLDAEEQAMARLLKERQEAEEQRHAELLKQAAAEASQKDRQKLYDALTVLGRTDHEIIKAAERLLAERLDPTLLEARREARELVKSEKIRLG